MGGLADYLSNIFKYFTGGSSTGQPNRKRRADEISNQDNKIRRIENININDGGARNHLSEFHRSTNRIEADFLPLNQANIGSVRILKWGQNGKENRVQYLPHHNSLNHPSAGYSTEEVQVLEENVKSSFVSRRNRNSLNMGSTSRSQNASRSCSGDEVEIEEIFPPSQKTFKKREPDVIETYRSPHLKKNADVIETYSSSQAKQDDEVIETYRSAQIKKKDNVSEVQILKERPSSSKERHSYLTPFSARKPFKAIDPCVQAASTPILFTSGRPLVRSPGQPGIMQSPSMTNGIDQCAHRSQSSLLPLDSIYSRKNSTLLHMKRAEESQLYDKVFKTSCGADRLLPKVTSPTSPNKFDTNFERSYCRTSFTFKPHKTNLDTSPSKDALSSERINVPVVRTQISEPSTSASRQTQDTDLQYLGEVNTSVQRLSQSYHPDVMEEILDKYRKMEEEKKAQIEQEKKSSKLLEERNRLALIDRHKQAEHELVDQIKNYLKVVEEEIVEEEEEEKVPPLPELTDAMNAEINRALAAPPDAVLSSAFNLTIKGRDMRTLKDLAWLNDEVINFYMNMIIERGKADNYPSVHAFNTFFFPKLISTGYDSLKRWTKKVDIFAHDYLLIPVHRGMHWCMAIIDMKEKVIRYYDSMDGRFPQCMDALLNYLHKESLDKKKQPFDATGWVKEHAEGIPQQNNGSDCGMFACMYAEYVSRGAPITFTQENMPYFRRKAVYEILKAKLLC